MVKKVRGETIFEKKKIEVKPDNTQENQNPPLESINAVDVLKQIFSDSEKSGMSEDDIKDIENIKLIISAILNDALLESLTNLEPDELDDINDAIYINEYADNPRLNLYILHRLKLSRSKVVNDKYSNLLGIFSDISGKGMKSLSGFDSSGILGNRFKKG